jgi:hypothetical protein
LGRLDGNRLEALFGRLEAFEGDFSPSHVEGALGAVLDQMNRLREGRTHMFDFGSGTAIRRVALRLLRRIPTENERHACIERLLPTLRWLSAQQELIGVARDHQLASKESIEKWKGELMERASLATPVQLMEERALGAFIGEAIKIGGIVEARMRTSLKDDSVFARMIASAMGDQHTYSFGDAASQQETRLPWKDLTKLFGAVELKRRVEEARARLPAAQMPPRVNKALDLAMKYAEGWRPKDTFREERDGEVESAARVSPDPP